MNILSRYVKDISTIVKVIILIFKTFPLVKGVNLPRLHWKKGRIAELIKGNNGLVRGVSLDAVVSTTNKTQCINRPLQHIIPLELKDIQ